MTRRFFQLLFAAPLVLAAATAGADGPGAYRPRAELPAAASEHSAIDAYNTGYASIQRAEHAENLSAAATTQSDRNTTQRQARSAYQDSLHHFERAVRADRSMHEAYTYMGYANRKLGRYKQALKAYEQALRINPDYPQAIEYQGQAFLGLNRVDAARFNYLRLYALDPEQAGKLFRAMQTWLAENQDQPPAGVDMEAFAAWIAQRATSVGAGSANAATTW